MIWASGSQKVTQAATTLWSAVSQVQRGGRGRPQAQSGAKVTGPFQPLPGGLRTAFTQGWPLLDMSGGSRHPGLVPDLRGCAQPFTISGMFLWVFVDAL